MTYPKFGVAGSCEAETEGHRSDQLEFKDGFSTDVFMLKLTHTLKRNKPSSCAATYGIGKSDEPAKNSLGVALESVTLTEEEEVTPPHMIATQPGVSPVLGNKLTYTDGLIFHRLKKTIRIVGKGDPPAALGKDKIGQTYAGPITVAPAVGAAPIISEEDLYIASVEFVKSITDWHKFTIELIKYEPKDIVEDPTAQENMIVPTLWTVAELDHLSAWRKITRTTTLNFNGPADIDETVELYDDSHEPTATTTTTTTSTTTTTTTTTS